MNEPVYSDGLLVRGCADGRAFACCVAHAPGSARAVVRLVHAPGGRRLLLVPAQRFGHFVRQVTKALRQSTVAGFEHPATQAS